MNDTIANNNAINNKQATSWYPVFDSQYNIDFNTNSGRALWFLVALYWFLKPLNYSWINNQVLSSLSSIGSFLWFELNICANLEYFLLYVPRMRFPCNRSHSLSTFWSNTTPSSHTTDVGNSSEDNYLPKSPAPSFWFRDYISINTIRKVFPSFNLL